MRLLTTLSLLVLLGLPASGAEPTPREEPGVPEDVADVPCEDLRVVIEESMRYFLIGPDAKAEAPEGGYRLVVVLPGGDGSASFQPFVRRIWKRALGEDTMVAQLVAPVWSEEQSKKLVWPTQKSPWPAMRFSTEKFIHAVIADAAKRRKIDSTKVLVLAWSSGGPAAYAYSLTPGCKATGAFVAMSVFKPEELPGLRGAKGKAYYLLHSPEDFIPIRYAESARDLLAEAGAQTKLETYPGGHGWRGDVFGTIRKGIEWLEEQRTAQRSKD